MTVWFFHYPNFSYVLFVNRTDLYLMVPLRQRGMALQSHFKRWLENANLLLFSKKFFCCVLKLNLINACLLGYKFNELCPLVSYNVSSIPVSDKEPVLKY